MGRLIVLFICISILFLLGCSLDAPIFDNQGSSAPGIWPENKPIPNNESEQPTKFIDRPPQETWNFVVKAGTYVFYAKNCWMAGDDIVIKGYWADANFQWAWYEGYRTFSAQVFSPLSVRVKEDNTKQTMETETYVTDFNRTLPLLTVQHWEGNSPREIKFNNTKSPWVINAGYTPTSAISTKFIVTVWKGNIGTPVLEDRFGQFAGVSYAVIEETGTFTIQVQSSGCEWWVKVGVEP